MRKRSAHGRLGRADNPPGRRGRRGVTSMATQYTKQMESCKAARTDTERVWQGVEDAVLRLQEATERARESLTAVAPQQAQDPTSWQILDPLLRLEELSLDAGRVVDDVKRALDASRGGGVQGGKEGRPAR